MDRIASRQNPIVKRFRDAAHGGGSASGTVLLDGEHLVLEALRSDVPLELVALGDEAHDALADRIRAIGAPIVRVSERVLAAISPVRQPTGVVALAAFAPSTLDRCLARAPQLVLMLSGVQDAGNVGAIVRAAEAFGATGVVCCENTADPFGWKALRGAMGSTFRLPVAVGQRVQEVITVVRQHGAQLLATVPRGGPPLDAVDLRVPSAVILGTEGVGLSPEEVAAADQRLTIPMRDPVESLNVAVAAALVVYEASRQRGGG